VEPLPGSVLLFQGDVVPKFVTHQPREESSRVSRCFSNRPLGGTNEFEPVRLTWRHKFQPYRFIEQPAFPNQPPSVLDIFLGYMPHARFPVPCSRANTSGPVRSPGGFLVSNSEGVLFKNQEGWPFACGRRASGWLFRFSIPSNSLVSLCPA
jgi:hypothetical protein